MEKFSDPEKIFSGEISQGWYHSYYIGNTTYKNIGPYIEEWMFQKLSTKAHRNSCVSSAIFFLSYHSNLSFHSCLARALCLFTSQWFVPKKDYTKITKHIPQDKLMKAWVWKRLNVCSCFPFPFLLTIEKVMKQCVFYLYGLCTLWWLRDSFNFSHPLSGSPVFSAKRLQKCNWHCISLP